MSTELILGGNAPMLRTIGVGFVSSSSRLHSASSDADVAAGLLANAFCSMQACNDPLYPSPTAGMTAEPSMIRSVPSGAPRGILLMSGQLCEGVELPENGSKAAGHPKPRLLMSPVRTTRSASGEFSVRSYFTAQSWF